MTYLEGTKYKLQADYYESILLECTYVEGNIVYFQHTGSTSSFHDYKLNQKAKKLYVWNSKFSSWDSVENTLSECGVDDIWINKRVGNDYYSGLEQD